MANEDLRPEQWDSKTYLKYNDECVTLTKLIESMNLNELEKREHRHRHILLEKAVKKYDQIHFPVQNQYS